MRERVGRWLGPLVCAAVLLLPSPSGMSGDAWRMAAVALWMAIWWMTEAVPIPVTSLLPLPLFPALGILPTLETAAHYGNQLVFLFFGGFVLALALERWGLHRRIALLVIAAVGGSPRRIILGFMLGCAVLSMWMSNSAATLVMFPIGVAVVHQVARGARLGEQSGEEVEQRITREFGAVLMLALAYSASIGGVGTLIGTPPNLVFAGAVREIFPAAPEIGFLRWMLVGLPLAAVFLLFAWWFLSFRVPKFDLGLIQSAGAERGRVRGELTALGPMTGAERWVATVFCLTALGWVFRAPVTLGEWHLPGWSALLPRPAFLHDATVAMGAAVLLLALPAVRRSASDGGGFRSAISWDRVQSRTPWGILLLFGGGLALAGGFQGTGLAQWIGDRLGGLASVPPIVLVALTCLTVTFLTELTSNTATATMLMPVLAATAVGAGFHPYLLMLPAALSGSCAFMLPVATPPNAIVFGSGWVDIPRMARVGLWMNLVGVILVTLTVYLVARPVFGIVAGVIPAWATSR